MPNLGLLSVIFWKSERSDSILTLFFSYFDDTVLSALVIETGEFSRKVNIKIVASGLCTLFELLDSHSLILIQYSPYNVGNLNVFLSSRFYLIIKETDILSNCLYEVRPCLILPL